ncbi:MAG: hypothetical protein ACI4U3_02130 [Traorella sp.]
MAIEINEKIIIHDEIKQIIQSSNYEKIIFQLISESKIVFPNEYKHIQSQSKGECNFIDLCTGEKFDAKLPFTTDQGRLVGSRNSNYLKWIQFLQEETEEFSDCNTNGKEIKDLKLYKVLEKQIIRDKIDENLIFFPYHIVMDFSIPSLIHFAGDILTHIYLEHKKIR